MDHIAIGITLRGIELLERSITLPSPFTIDKVYFKIAC